MDLRSLRKRITPTSWSVENRRRWRDRWLRRFGVTRSHEPEILANRPEWRLTSLLKFVVADRVLAGEEFTFMQIGAYDGVGDDDLRDLIVRHGLRGAVIEPQPNAYARLVENYRSQPQVTPLCAAISDAEGMQTLFHPRTGDAMTASFDRGHLLRHGIAAEDIAEQAVPCHTVASAMRVVGIDDLDLLQIDAEGHDHRIIKSINFTRLRAKLIRFEYRHIPPAEIDRCIELLAEWGYRFIIEEKDIIACLECQHATAALAA